MSKRDILLLKILGVLVLLIVPNYFITKNIVVDIIASYNQVEKLKVQEEQYENVKNKLPELEDKLTEFTKQFEDASPNTAIMCKTYEAHYLFSKLAKENNLALSSLNLSELTELEDVKYDEKNMAGFNNSANGILVTKEDEEKMSTEENSSGSSKSESQEKDTIDTLPSELKAIRDKDGNIAVYKLSINYTVSGRIEDMLNLADSISKYSKFMVVSNFSIPDLESVEEITTSATVTVFLSADKTENTEVTE